jgi:hypothetical protein
VENIEFWNFFFHLKNSSKLYKILEREIVKFGNEKIYLCEISHCCKILEKTIVTNSIFLKKIAKNIKNCKKIINTFLYMVRVSRNIYI